MNCRQQLGDELCEIGRVHFETTAYLFALVEPLMPWWSRRAVGRRSRSEVL